jgi:hypothetical protein
MISVGVALRVFIIVSFMSTPRAAEFDRGLIEEGATWDAVSKTASLQGTI